MAAGATYDIHITSPTTAGTSGSLPNTACASATNAGTVCDLALIVVNPPNLVITKTADATPVSSGTSIGFTITVSNTGPGTATGVTVFDALPALGGVDWTIQSQTGSACLISGSVLDQVLGCTIGDMAPGATYHIHITTPTTAQTAGTRPNTLGASAGN